MSTQSHQSDLILIKTYGGREEISVLPKDEEVFDGYFAHNNKQTELI